MLGCGSRQPDGTSIPHARLAVLSSILTRLELSGMSNNFKLFFLPCSLPSPPQPALAPILALNFLSISLLLFFAINKIAPTPPPYLSFLNASNSFTYRTLASTSKPYVSKDS